MMAEGSISYRSGYKYQLTEGYSVEVDVKPDHDIDTEYIHLFTNGLLKIEKSYAWDGPSGPTVDTKTFMRGALAHDALYQLMRSTDLDGEKWRKTADDELKRICREDCMSRIRAWYVHRAVRKAAGYAALPEAQKEIHRAPRRHCNP